MPLSTQDKRQIWVAMEILDKLRGDVDPDLKKQADEARNLLEKILQETNRRER